MSIEIGCDNYVLVRGLIIIPGPRRLGAAGRNGRSSFDSF